MKLKQMLKLIVFFVIASAFYASAYAAENSKSDKYSDIPVGWSHDAVVAAVESGVLQGIDDKILPKSPLTRAQLAAMINRTFEVNGAADISSYRDVLSNSWYYNDVAKSVSASRMVGTGTLFYPNDYTNREQVFSVLARALNIKGSDSSSLSQFSDEDSISPWAREELAAMIDAGYMFGSNGKLQPKAKITREEFVYVLYINGKLEGVNYKNDNAVIDYTNNYPIDIIEPPVADTIPEEVPIEEPQVTEEEPLQNIEANDNNASVSESLIINEAVASLDNKVINGDLEIQDCKGVSELTFNSLKVGGKILIKDASLSKINIVGNSEIDKIVLSSDNDDLNLVVGDAFVGAVDINSGKYSVVLNGRVGTVNVNSHVPVTLAGVNASELNVSTLNSDVTVRDNSAIGNIAIGVDAVYTQLKIMLSSTASTVDIIGISSLVSVTGNSTVNNMTVHEQSVGSAVSAEQLSTINTLNVNAADVTVTALKDGAVSRLILSPNAKDTIIDIDSSSTVNTAQ